MIPDTDVSERADTLRKAQLRWARHMLSVCHTSGFSKRTDILWRAHIKNGERSHDGQRKRFSNIHQLNDSLKFFGIKSVPS
jgi:hypothetical protein